ncbi:MAG: hypothetical protein C4334_04695 [Pyrinomonas sp.]
MAINFMGRQPAPVLCGFSLSASVSAYRALSSAVERSADYSTPLAPLDFYVICSRRMRLV